MREMVKIDAHLEIEAPERAAAKAEDAELHSDLDEQSPELAALADDGYRQHGVVAAVLVEVCRDEARTEVSDPPAQQLEQVSAGAETDSFASSAGGILLPFDVPSNAQVELETASEELSSKFHTVRMIEASSCNRDWARALESDSTGQAAGGVWLPIIQRHVKSRDNARDQRLAKMGLRLPASPLAASDCESLFRTLDQRELVLGLQLVHTQWRELAPSLNKFDGLRCVVDHLALPLDLSRAGRAQWSADLRQISHIPGAHLHLAPTAIEHAAKATFSSARHDFAALDSFVYEAIDQFGVERCLFATALTDVAKLDDVMQAFYRWFERFTLSEREKLFASNARELFRWCIQS